MTATFAQPKQAFNFEDYYNNLVRPYPIFVPTFTPKEDVGVSDVLNRYIIKDKDSVLDFLRRNMNLLPYLETAPDKIRFYFKDMRAKLSLEVIYDPEVEPEHDHGTLFINVLSRGSLEDRMAKLDNLTKEWLVTIPPQDHLYFEVDLDFS